MKITTLPVYSKLADEADVPAEVRGKLPKGWRLSQHQVDTYRALTEGDADVIFNTAMTGDGKSLAAYAPTLINPHRQVFAMYPTNELLRDQGRQFEGYLEKFGYAEGNIPFDTLWGAELSRMQKEVGLRTRDAILGERFRNLSVILTNPDIFNLVMNYTYGQKTLIFTEQELPYTLGAYFDYFLFDEFHIFAIPQVVAVISAMLYFQKQNPGRQKFVFSSATPVQLLEEMLERSRLKYKIIRGDYATVPGEGYRPVLHPSTLNFYKLDERASAETWVREHVTDIVDFWKSCEGHAKGAIIVNSVSTARRITRWLENELYPHNITVGENTGLTDNARRRDSLSKHIVIGTSTIDVGVDFNINFLVFESINGGTFLQRLGRLGRVKQEVVFSRYEAHALLSGKAPWIYARLEQAFQDGEEVERSEHLRDVVRNAFPQENDFKPYIKRWGMLHPAHVIEVLQKRKDTYQQLADMLKEDFEKVFDASFSKAHGRYWGIRKGEEKGRKISDEVLAFRGSSPFQVACWDATVHPPAFMTYDLFWVVQNTDYIVVDAKEYEQAVQRHAPEAERAAAMETLKYTLGHSGETPLIVRIEAFYEEREQLVLGIGKDLAGSNLNDQVKVLSGFRIREPRTVASLSAINRILERQNVVCYCTRDDTRELRRMLHLPAMFPLFQLQDMYNKTYTVAFGKTALLLDSVVLKYYNKHLEDTPIII